MRDPTPGLSGWLLGITAVWQSDQARILRDLRNLRDSARRTQSDLWALFARGEFVRLKAPLVQDFLLGLASARPPTVALPVPEFPAPQRPALRFEPSPAWPPGEGRYDDAGSVLDPGQSLTALGLSLTYDEVRAFLIGLTQPEAPTSAQSSQVALAARAFSEVVLHLAETSEGYLEAWRRVFARARDQGPYSKPPGLPLGGDFPGQTVDAAAKTIGQLATTKDGIYKVSAVCGIQRADGLGGSLTVVATFSKYANALTLIRSDRLNAQLSPALVGVDARFVAQADQVQLQVVGKSAMVLFWDNHLSMFVPS